MSKPWDRTVRTVRYRVGVSSACLRYNNGKGGPERPPLLLLRYLEDGRIVYHQCQAVAFVCPTCGGSATRLAHEFATPLTGPFGEAKIYVEHDGAAIVCDEYAGLFPT
jgi:hypothetical protein